MKGTLYFYTSILNHDGMAYVLHIATFSAFTIYAVPQLIDYFYEFNIWHVLHIERATWIYITSIAILSSLVFINTNEALIGDISFSKSGLGKISYGSLILAPVFEEFLFRGVLLSLSSRVFNKKTTIRINGILFAVWHFGIIFSYGFVLLVPLLILATGVFGYFLASFQYNHRNLVISIALHSLATIILALTGIF